MPKLTPDRTAAPHSTPTFSKRARPLFALLAPATLAACASGVAASSPLCDGVGAPACGNIGQAGRQGTPMPPTSSPVRATVNPPRTDAQTFPMFELATTTLAVAGVAATTMAVLIVSDWGDPPEHIALRVPEVPRAPLATPPETPLSLVPPAPVRPLVAVAAVRAPLIVKEARPDADAEDDECARDQAQRPVVDNDYRPACGNVMTKGGHRRGQR